jgi:hypothetical protein
MKIQWSGVDKIHAQENSRVKTTAKAVAIKAQIAREGFVYLPKRGKGSHERWRHPMLVKNTDNSRQGWRRCATLPRKAVSTVIK